MSRQQPLPSGFGAATTAREALGEQRLDGTTAIVTGGYAGGEALGYVAGHLTRRFGCEGELQWIYVVADDAGAELLRACWSCWRVGSSSMGLVFCAWMLVTTRPGRFIVDTGRRN